MAFPCFSASVPPALQASAYGFAGLSSIIARGGLPPGGVPQRRHGSHGVEQVFFLPSHDLREAKAGPPACLPTLPELSRGAWVRALTFPRPLCLSAAQPRLLQSAASGGHCGGSFWGPGPGGCISASGGRAAHSSEAWGGFAQQDGIPGEARAGQVALLHLSVGSRTMWMGAPSGGAGVQLWQTGLMCR